MLAGIRLCTAAQTRSGLDTKDDRPLRRRGSAAAGESGWPAFYRPQSRQKASGQEAPLS